MNSASLFSASCDSASCDSASCGGGSVTVVAWQGCVRLLILPIFFDYFVDLPAKWIFVNKKNHQKFARDIRLIMFTTLLFLTDLAKIFCAHLRRAISLSSFHYLIEF